MNKGDTKMNIELTKEMLDAYNDNERVLMCDNEHVNLSITKDRTKIYSYRENGKKYGCYMLPQREIDALNEGKEILFYNGALQVSIIKNIEGDL